MVACYAFYESGISLMACTGREKLTSLSTAATLTTAKVADCSHVWLQALTQNVRMTLEGTTPTSSVGIRLTAGDPPIEISGEDARSAKFIEETASAVLEVVYFGYSGS